MECNNLKLVNITKQSQKNYDIETANATIQNQENNDTKPARCNNTF